MNEFHALFVHGLIMCWSREYIQIIKIFLDYQFSSCNNNYTIRYNGKIQVSLNHYNYYYQLELEKDYCNKNDWPRMWMSEGCSLIWNVFDCTLHKYKIHNSATHPGTFFAIKITISFLFGMWVKEWNGSFSRKISFSVLLQ